MAFQARTGLEAFQATAFPVGLLQDFAVPIMAGELGERYAALSGSKGLNTTPATVVAEQRATGLSHADFARGLFER